jgi:hypothetical protein
LPPAGATVPPGFPRDGWSAIGRLITEETDKWGQVIRAANIKPE